MEEYPFLRLRLFVQPHFFTYRSADQQERPGEQTFLQSVLVETALIKEELSYRKSAAGKEAVLILDYGRLYLAGDS